MPNVDAHFATPLGIHLFGTIFGGFSSIHKWKRMEENFPTWFLATKKYHVLRQFPVFVGGRFNFIFRGANEQKHPDGSILGQRIILF